MNEFIKSPADSELIWITALLYLDGPIQCIARYFGLRKSSRGDFNVSDAHRAEVSSDSNPQWRKTHLFKSWIYGIAHHYKKRQTQIDGGIALASEGRIVDKSNKTIASWS